MAEKGTSPRRKQGSGGARVGAGRKPCHVEADLQSLMDGAWPQADRVSVVKALHLAALDGDVKAAVALLDRALGKPVERVMQQREADDTLKIQVEYADPEPRDG